jgi:hypothetical protein
VYETPFDCRRPSRGSAFVLHRQSIVEVIDGLHHSLEKARFELLSRTIRLRIDPQWVSPHPSPRRGGPGIRTKCCESKSSVRFALFVAPPTAAAFPHGLRHLRSVVVIAPPAKPAAASFPPRADSAETHTHTTSWNLYLQQLCCVLFRVLSEARFAPRVVPH